MAVMAVMALKATMIVMATMAIMAVMLMDARAGMADVLMAVGDVAQVLHHSWHMSDAAVAANSFRGPLEAGTWSDDMDQTECRVDGVSLRLDYQEGPQPGTSTRPGPVHRALL